ncbi:MAG: phospholipid/cholesterol/gamma-HCH transport system substrate-binding protein [Desulfobacteraceae bacterium Eth-SRB1]|nr:MAG: phospholipid/cholesterol/gamma-HCH transport system substrate-binding protein [Desulfobacteraceae bacterium Eth-SRB1]
MESHAKYTLVGCTLIVLTMLIVASIFWLSEAGMRGKTRFYTVYFEKHSLSGLQVDSEVTMRGIKVGTVSQLHISHENIERVKVIVKLDAETPIKRDTKAVIRRNLLTGLADIDLVRSSQESPPLTEIKEGEEYPVIPEGKTKLEAIRQTLPKLLENISEVVHRAGTVFTPENQMALKKALHNVTVITERLAKSEGKLPEMIDEISDLATEMRVAVKRLDERSAAAGLSLTKTAAVITRQAEEVPRMVEGLRTLAKNLDAKTAEVSHSLTNSAARISRVAESLAEELTETARKLSATLEAYEDPKASLWGPNLDSLGPGERETR